jgi:hypothetical protein
VKLAGVGGQVICAEDEGHRGEGALGGEKVFDEDLDGNGCGGRAIVAVFLRLVVWAAST